MNREIKFRAWQNGEMVYAPITTNFGLHRFFGMTSDESKVMQYTGLKDKNGKEIYEGDIVKFHTFTQELGSNLGVTEGERSWLCEISMEEFGLWLNGNTEQQSGYAIWFNGIHEESFEVIGNIYENPL